ncbi:SEC-C domain-containing protein [Bacillus paramycoides]|uniref:SEC-C domain-containing protein n=1 Tax=Bacillus paramycoides TaxID=2026194 RepID=UPI0037F1F8C2
MVYNTITGMGKLKFEAYELCPCGSEKKFKFCCYPKAKEDKPKKFDNYSIGRIQHMMTQYWEDTDFEVCMGYEKERCENLIKSAHSIQNNRILNRISKDGHVYCMVGKAEKGGFKSEFKKVSKNKASTFFGFCGYHDTEIFKPIELQEYQQEPIQSFLFAFRAHALQYHRKQRELKNIQNIFRDFPYLMLESHFVDRYRTTCLDVSDYAQDHVIFEEGFSNGNFNNIRTISRQLDFEVNFATSSAFAVQYDLNGKQINNIYFDQNVEKMPSIYVTVYPSENGTNIILSYHLEDEITYKEYFDQLESLSTEKLLEYLNYLIVEYTENVFFNPDFIETLTDKQKDSMLRSFASSIFILEKFDLMNENNYYNFDLFKKKSTD